jgi:hypothetical protein
MMKPLINNKLTKMYTMQCLIFNWTITVKVSFLSRDRERDREREFFLV